jgi:hypothetical protein
MLPLQHGELDYYDVCVYVCWLVCIVQPAVARRQNVCYEF